MDKKKKTILIIEDKLSLVEIIVSLLEKEGFLVLTAKNGLDGIKMALKNHPDVILVDIVIPDMNGLELLNRLRNNKDSWGKTAEIILLTDLDNKKIISIADNDDCFDYLLNVNWKVEDVVAKVKGKLV